MLLRRSMRLALAPLLFLMLGWAPALAQPAPAARVALIIGNGGYTHTTPLPNAGNDAEDVARVLQGMGFTVTLARDLGRAEMNRTIREFGERAQGAAVALLFYAGHGMQLARGVAGENYLVPIDARLADVRDVDEETISLTRVLERMDGALSRIVILDACRDNPLAGQMRGQTATRSVARGLARIEAAERGTLLAFSTEPGNVALDGNGRNSPFASALIEHLPTAGLDVRLVLTRVRAAVVAHTQGRQTPWSSDGLMQEVALQQAAPVAPVPAAVAMAPVPAAPDALAAELAFWSSVQNTTDPRELEAYLQAFPQGRFVPLARARLERLQAAQSATRTPAREADSAAPQRAALPTIDGIWRYSRVSAISGVHYSGSIVVNGSSGRNRVQYQLRDNVRTIVEFDVAIVQDGAGVTFRATSPPRFIERGASPGYVPDNFVCRWVGDRLSCTNVEITGRGSTTPFVLSR